MSSLPVPSSSPEPAWLPGDVEVQVSGGIPSAAIREACRSSRACVPDVAVLVPNRATRTTTARSPCTSTGSTLATCRSRSPPRSNLHWSPSLPTPAADRACPARILWHEIDGYPVAHVILSLNPAPLGLGPEAFNQVPELDRVLQQYLSRLDAAAAPAMTGCDPAARNLLAATEALRVQADANYGRGAVRWPQVEHAFRQVIPR